MYNNAFYSWWGWNFIRNWNSILCYKLCFFLHFTVAAFKHIRLCHWCCLTTQGSIFMFKIRHLICRKRWYFSSRPFSTVMCSEIVFITTDILIRYKLLHLSVLKAFLTELLGRENYNYLSNVCFGIQEIIIINK